MNVHHVDQKSIEKQAKHRAEKYVFQILSKYNLLVFYFTHFDETALDIDLELKRYVNSIR